jgi:hypothetical protein
MSIRGFLFLRRDQFAYEESAGIYEEKSIVSPQKMGRVKKEGERRLTGMVVTRPRNRPHHCLETRPERRRYPFEPTICMQIKRHES